MGRKLWSALLLALALITGPNLVNPAPAEAVTYRAVCGNRTFTGKDPSLCKESYRVYQITANRPRLVWHTNNAKGVNWKAVRRSWRSAENWCKDNPITCGVMLMAGWTIITGWTGAHS